MNIFTPSSPYCRMTASFQTWTIPTILCWYLDRVVEEYHLEGFLYFDFVPDNDDKAGPPYFSQFAFATFSGDNDAMHKREGYDDNAMYDVTRNIILGQGVGIPYPEKYWTAEVFLDGYDKPGTAFLFSVIL